MVTAWRRAFCTSISKHQDPPTATTEKQDDESKTPRFVSKFGFFSNPSTPRSQSQPAPTSPALRCRAVSAATPPSSLPATPRKISPKSPSSFSILKATLRLSKQGRCGICLQNVKTGQGSAIFTSECSHSFHFHCITGLMKKQPLMSCPVCTTVWKELPLLSVQKRKPESEPESKPLKEIQTKPLRVYDDDEPLASPVSLAHFNPIPESDETEEDDDAEFQGFSISNNSTPRLSKPIVVAARNVDLRLLPEAAVLAATRSYETFVAVLKVKAPALPAARWSRRAPVDLVAVVDVSRGINLRQLQMMKRAMKVVISLLSETDRLSVVAFSSASKRLSPLRRMNSNGRRFTRRIVDALGNGGEGMSVNDAVKKAAKILEDRREKNAFATIIVLSDGQNERPHTTSLNHSRPVVTTTRFLDTEIPVHSIRFGTSVKIPNDDVFGKFLSGLLSLAVQDLTLRLGFVTGSAPAEISSVYSLTGKPACVGSNNVRVGDLCSEEERELLVELKVAGTSSGSRRVMSVRSSHRDPFSQEMVQSMEQGLLIPLPQVARSSSSPAVGRLRNLHISSRAVAESRRLMERNDLSGAYHLLSSARALLVQSGAEEFLRPVEAELAEVNNRRQIQPSGRSGARAEPLTPNSAWRAAERLAKVAIMRKHLNRVSDLHGLENARF